jgi:hypothetical protein
VNDPAARRAQHLIMHFTHIRNLPGILAAGYLRPDNGVRREQVAVVEAADPVIKERRRTIRVRRPPYGCVGDYVPFYFAGRSPMLLALASGRVPGYTDRQDRLIYLVSTVERAAAAGLRCLFSDGNCASTFTQVYDDLRRIDEVVDWPLMQARMWNNTAEDPDRMRRRMAEFLVHERMPVGCLVGIAVRTAVVKGQVQAILGECGVALPVRVRPTWYF